MWCSGLGRELSVLRPGVESSVTPIAYDEPMLIWWEGRAAWRRVSSLKFRHFFFLFLNFYILESGKFLKRQLCLLCFSFLMSLICALSKLYTLCYHPLALWDRGTQMCVESSQLMALMTVFVGSTKQSLREVHTHWMLNTYSANYSPVIQ